MSWTPRRADYTARPPMPFTLLAHQLPVLPLQLRLGRRVNGTALVLGTMGPDFEYLIANPPAGASVGHSLLGQLVVVPLLVLVVWAIGRFDLGRALAMRLGARAAWLSGVATDVREPGGVMRAAAFALLGSLSHLALDALTHHRPGGLLPAAWFTLWRVPMSSTTVAQAVVTFVGGPIGLWLALRVVAQRQREAAPLAQRPGRGVIAAGAVVGAAALLLHGANVIAHPIYYFDAPRLYLPGFVLFAAVIGAIAGALAAAGLLAALDRRAG